jgi:hypothetical protein
MATYSRVKDKEIKFEQLQAEINSSSDIVPSCLGISLNGTQIDFEFAADLSGAEETALDAIIASHTPEPDVINVTELPLSKVIDGKKLAVHSSSKPEPDGYTTYAVWTGAGDKWDSQTESFVEDESESIGNGELLNFNLNYEPEGAHEESKEIRFDPRHGKVWIHEAYVKFEGAGVADYLSASIMAPATKLQTVANLDLVIVDNCIKYSPSGPGTGTHGFAATPVLIPRSFSNDGDWDYDGTNLLPNMSGTGEYKISSQEVELHRYFNKLPLNGSSSTYFTMTSDETADLRAELGYYLKVTVNNQSNSNWNCSIFMEIFRERTAVP